MKSLVSLALAVAGCGGSAFSAGLGAALDPDAAPSLESGSAPAAESSVGPTDARPDAGQGAPEAQSPDAPEPREAQGRDAADGAPPSEAAPPEAGPEDTGAPDAPMKCTPAPRGSGQCLGTSFVTPAEFCVGTYHGTSPEGAPAPTPAACQCAGMFTCACVLLGPVCPPPTSAHCIDTDAGPGVTCL